MMTFSRPSLPRWLTSLISTASLHYCSSWRLVDKLIVLNHSHVYTNGNSNSQLKFPLEYSENHLHYTLVTTHNLLIYLTYTETNPWDYLHLLVY